jgi:hypothetical protein
MDYFNRPPVTNLERKIRDLVNGYNSNSTTITSHVAAIVAFKAGNIGEHITAIGSTISDSRVKHL